MTRTRTYRWIMAGATFVGGVALALDASHPVVGLLVILGVASAFLELGRGTSGSAADSP